MQSQSLAFQQKTQKKFITKRRRKTTTFLQTAASQRFNKIYGQFDSFYLQEDENTQTAKQILKKQGQIYSDHEEQYFSRSQRSVTRPQKLSQSHKKNIQGWVEQETEGSWLGQQQDKQSETNGKKIIIHKKNQKSYLLNYIYKCQEILQINQENINEPIAPRKKSSKAQMKATVVVINDPPKNKKINCVLNGRIIKIKQRIDKIKHVNLPKRNIQSNFNQIKFKTTPPLHSLSYSALNFPNQPVQKSKFIKHKIHQTFTKKLQTQANNTCHQSKTVLHILQNNKDETNKQGKIISNKYEPSREKQLKKKITLKVRQIIQSEDNRANNLKLSSLIKAQKFKSLDSRKQKRKSIYRAPTYSIRQMVESYINRNLKVEHSQNQNQNQNCKADMRMVLSKQKYSHSSCQKSKTCYPIINGDQPGLSEAVRKTIKTILDFKCTRDRYKTQ